MPSIASRLCTSVVAFARGIPSDCAARVKLLVSTMRTKVRIAMMRSITGVSPVDLEALRALSARNADACLQRSHPGRRHATRKYPRPRIICLLLSCGRKERRLRLVSRWHNSCRVTVVAVTGHGSLEPVTNVLVARSSRFVLRRLRGRSRAGACTCIATNLVITIVMAQPVHHVVLFVASLRREVEQGIGADERLAAASICGERMEHIARLVLVEHADTRQFVAVEALRRDVVHVEVVVHLAFGPLFGRERHMIVVVEVAAMRRHPAKMPAHAFPERFDFRKWCARHSDIGDIALLDMQQRTVDMIGQERAAWAPLVPVRP